MSIVFGGRWSIRIWCAWGTFGRPSLHSVANARRVVFFFFFSSRRRHTRFDCDWSSDVCSSDLAGTPVRVLGAGLSIATALGVAAIWFEPYRRARIFSFINPWHDAQGAGFQIVQAMIGLGSGGIFGRGLGQSIEKANFLPEAHTDMIFAIIGEELGLVGATALIAAYATF